MKYNPKVNEAAAAMPGFRDLHPLQDPALLQGALRLMYELGEYLTELRVMKDSPLIGKTVRASKLAKEHEVKLLRLIRKGRSLARARFRRLKPADILLIEGKVTDLMNLKDAEKLEIAPEHQLQGHSTNQQNLLWWRCYSCLLFLLLLCHQQLRCQCRHCQRHRL